MAVLASAALVLTLAVAPRTNRIYYDEHIYQGIAQNLADLRLAQTCNEGNVEYGRLQCFAGEYNKQPYAYPHLLSAAYRVFGVRESAAFSVNAFVMALSVCAIYLLVVLLVDDRIAAFFAAFLLLLTPEQILWSATAAAEPSAALACIVAVACAAAFSRSGDGVALAATGVASAYAVQFRPESLLILPVVALVLWRRREEFDRLRFWWVALLALALLAVHVGHLCGGQERSVGHHRRAAVPDVPVDEPAGQPPVLPGRLALPGRVHGAGDPRGRRWRPRTRARCPRCLVPGVLRGLSPVLRRQLRLRRGRPVFAHDLRAAGRARRGSGPPASWGGRSGWVGARFRPQTALAGAIAFTFLWYAPLVRATTQEAWAARADVRFVHSIAPRPAGQRLRAGAQSRDVPPVGRERRPDVADRR